MKLSKLSAGLKGQPMFLLKKKIREYELLENKKILHFEIGDSHWSPLPSVVEAAVDSLHLGETHYTASGGMMELKEAIKKTTEFGYHFEPRSDQIVVMPANAVIDFAVRCVCDVGDEVIVTDPCFPTYTSVLNYTGIKAVTVPLSMEDNFNLNAHAVRERITPNTKLIIVNSPCNPTGSIIKLQDLQEIYQLCVEHNIYLLTDDVYSDLIYNLRSTWTPAQEDRCAERVILLQSFSKTYAMTGFRLGYVIAPEPLAEKMMLMFQTIFSCMPVFIQRAGIAALESDWYLSKIRRKYLDECRLLVVSELNKIKGLRCNLPIGAFYVFPSIKDTKYTSESFADLLLERQGVAVLPGNNFGSQGEGFIRICYATEMEILQEGLRRIKDFLS